MPSSRNVVPFLLAIWALLVVSAVAPVPAAAQDMVICAWCEEEGWWFWRDHRFTAGGFNCDDPPGEQCVRCGRDSDCHTEWRGGACHIPCGPDGGQMQALADAVSQIRAGLDAADVTMVATAILDNRADLVIKYRGQAGRIDFMLPCDRDVPVATVAIVPGVQTELDAAMTSEFAESVRFSRRVEEV